MREPPGHIFLRFLRFGLLAWGGPAAQIAMIRRECVDELGWLGDEEFAKTLAVYQVLPGPEAHELCVHLGVLRGGRLGGFLAGLGFMLPGFVLMVAASALYVEVGIDQDLFYGLQAAVAALVAMAVVRLARAFVTDLALAVLARRGVRGVALLGTRRSSSCSPPAGSSTGRGGGSRAAARARSRRARWPSCSCWRSSLPLGAQLFLEGLKTGLLTFGGAYSAVPLLQQSAVEGHGWLTQDQLVDGLAHQRHPAGADDHLRDVHRLPRGRARRRGARSPSACSSRRSSSRSTCTGSSSRRRRTSGCARSCSA